MLSDLLIWDWNSNPDFEIKQDFISDAYDHAKKNFPKNVDEKFCPRIDDLVENFTGDFVKTMDLTEAFTTIKAEASELQKFLINLGFNQPVIFEICRMKVNRIEN